jgi:hypothetical protein
MANMLNGNFPNQYGVYGAPIPNYMQNNNVDQLYNTYKTMMENNPYLQQQQNQNSNPSLGQSGSFMFVKSFNEVENYPVSPDGRPTLFFMSNGIFWSKKFLNGKTVIQTFNYGTMNTNGESGALDSTQETQNADSNIDNNQNKEMTSGQSRMTQDEHINSDSALFDAIMQRIDEINKKVVLLDKRTKKLNKENNKNKEKEVNSNVV